MRSLVSQSEEPFTPIVFLDQRIKTFLKVTLIVGKAGKQLNIVRKDRHPILRPESVNETSGRFNALLYVRELAPAVIDDQDNRTGQAGTVTKEEMADLLRYAVFVNREVASRKIPNRSSLLVSDQHVA